MKLSIVIVHYNTPDFLERCLSMLWGEQGISHDWEVIVVDNASESENRKKVVLLSKKFGFKLIKNDKNTGFAQANNAAIQVSSGEYILLLNPDTEAHASAIETVLGYMHNRDDVAIATAQVVLPSGRLDDACHRGFPTPWNALCHFSGLSALFPKSRFFNGYHLGYEGLDTIHEIDACVGAFMMIRRSAGDALDWLDEDYFWYGEDIDICYRVKEKGMKVMYIPTAKILHYKGVASGIKETSKNVSKATEKTKKTAQRARFSAMRIFYNKHYAKRYPWIVTKLTMLGINIVEDIIS